LNVLDALFGPISEYNKTGQNFSPVEYSELSGIKAFTIDKKWFTFFAKNLFPSKALER